jgi:hypothetical protein
MKKLITIFCAILSFESLTSFGSLHASSSYSSEEENLSMFIEHEWTGDEDYLYLNLDLNPSLIVPERYTTTLYKDAVGCNLKIDLSTDCELEYKGQQVSYYELKVILSNGNDKKSIFFDVTHIIHTAEVDGSKIKTNTYSIVKSGRVKNPSIDLTVRPEFLTAEDNDNYGRIIFKNAFPYSKM